MVKHQTIKQIEEKLKPYYSLIGMVIFVIGGFFAIYKFVVRPPDLAVSISKQETNYPSGINEKFINVLTMIQDSIHNTNVKSDAQEIYGYLLNANQYWSLELKNQTDKTIKNIRVRITNVTKLNAWAVSSDYQLEEEKDKVLKSITFQETSGVIYLNKIDELPAKAEASLYLWGKLPALNYDDNVFVTYDGGDAKPEKVTLVTGFKAYLIDYIYEIFFIVLVVFAAVYRQLLKRTINATP